MFRYFAYWVTASLTLGGVQGLPNKRADTSDAAILSFALSMEYIQEAFYNQSLTALSSANFSSAGYPNLVRNWYQQILTHEQSHITKLKGLIGNSGGPVPQACNYTFPISDATSFVNLSSAIATVGTSTYAGLAPRLSDETLRSQIIDILAIEAKHNAWISAVGRNANPWDGPEQVPLTIDQAYSLLSVFVQQCPPSNPQIAVKSVPSFTVTPLDARPGQTVTLNFNGTSTSSRNDTTPYHLVFLTSSGSQPASAPISSNNTVVLPAVAELRGTVFGFVSTKANVVDESSTVAGPVPMNFAFDSSYTPLSS